MHTSRIRDFTSNTMELVGLFPFVQKTVHPPCLCNANTTFEVTTINLWLVIAAGVAIAQKSSLLSTKEMLDHKVLVFVHNIIL